MNKYIPILQLRDPGPPRNHLPQGVAHLALATISFCVPVPSCVLMGPSLPSFHVPMGPLWPSFHVLTGTPVPSCVLTGAPCPSGFKCGVNGGLCGPVLLTSSLPLASRHGSSPGPGAVGAGLLCKMG